MEKEQSHTKQTAGQSWVSVPMLAVTFAFSGYHYHVIALLQEMVAEIYLA